MGSSCTTDSMTVYYPVESVQRLQAQRKQQQQESQLQQQSEQIARAASHTPPPFTSPPPPAAAAVGSPSKPPTTPVAFQQQQQKTTSSNAPSSSLDHSGFMTMTTNGTVIRGMSMNPFRTFPPLHNRKTRSRDTSFGGASELGESSFGADVTSPNNARSPVNERMQSGTTDAKDQAGVFFPTTRTSTAPLPIAQNKLPSPFDREDAFSNPMDPVAGDQSNGVFDSVDFQEDYAELHECSSTHKTPRSVLLTNTQQKQQPDHPFAVCGERNKLA